MKNRNLLSVLFTLIAFSAAAQQHYSFTDTVNTAIPDANPNGLFSSINVAGIPGEISNVTLSLNISGGYNGDLYAYLSSDNGGFTVLMNRVGRTGANPIGYSDAGFDVTFSDFATSDVHTYGGNGGNELTGTWQPDARNIDPQLSVDADPRTAFLSSFDNRTPNGTWVLFVGDFANESQSTLVTWTLNFDAVPEPSSLSLFAVCLGIWWLRMKRRQRS
jgi:subtilisin-like proprotein convertase family protein